MTKTNEKEGLDLLDNCFVCSADGWSRLQVGRHGSKSFRAFRYAVGIGFLF
jgi:hypothetical protein